MAIEAVAAGQVESAVKAAGLAVVSIQAGEGYAGTLTTRYTLALAADPAKTQTLELSEGFTADQRADSLKTYLTEAATRLRNPRPDCYFTLHGIPLSFGSFAWPFHGSTSGADTSILHGEIWLEDGNDPVLHAKVSASMTVTFQDVVGVPEQPFAEDFIYNAVRKTLDQGQIELVKSGNRQPVPVTTRYYSSKQKRFVFNDTTAEQRKAFLTGKLFWLSGVLGKGSPVWVPDPRDAQYLNTSVDELRNAAKALESEGLLKMTDTEFGASTNKLMERAGEFQVLMAEALKFLKPTFNEEMRSGVTNM